VAKGTCSVKICDRPTKARGLCEAHYKRWWITGDAGNDPVAERPIAICSVEGCADRVCGQGLCRKHHTRFLRHGDPNAVAMIMGDDDARFWSYVDRRGPDECWSWTGAPTPHGYGQFRAGGKNWRAHRWAFQRFTGPIPAHQTIDHMCHDPAACRPGPDCPHRLCVNPAHLEIATGRANTMRGGAASAVNARRTECVNGHPFDEANTIVTRSGRRRCRACSRERHRRYQARRRAVD
jgi:hypothetical protein